MTHTHRRQGASIHQLPKTCLLGCTANRIGNEGNTPSCFNMPRSSLTAQCSVTLPSETRNQCDCWTVKRGGGGAGTLLAGRYPSGPGARGGESEGALSRADRLPPRRALRAALGMGPDGLALPEDPQGEGAKR